MFHAANALGADSLGFPQGIGYETEFRYNTVKF